MGEGSSSRRLGGPTGRVSARLLAASLHVSRQYGWLLVAAGLLACWAITLLAGGAAIVPAHYFYIPILFAGIRFGAGGSFATALAAGVLAGPLSYADVSQRTHQTLLDWGTRTVFFVVIGQVLTAMIAIAVESRREELSDLDSARCLASALDDSRFEVYFQPIVSLCNQESDGCAPGTTERVTGAEALLRMHDTDGNLVGPDQFIPNAERTGMIRPVGEFVLRDACRQVVSWQARGLLGPSFMLSVNVSPLQLDAGDFAERVAGVLKETGLDPSWLQLEITETALAESREQFLTSLHSLRRLGVHLALDDFGTGHSTLAEVQRLPVDVIKIDRQFVATLGSGGSPIAENVVSLARSLGLGTVAEGVETDGQARHLRSLGCDSAQGYFYGHPVPADEFELARLAHGPSAGPDADLGAGPTRAELPRRSPADAPRRRIAAPDSAAETG